MNTTDRQEDTMNTAAAAKAAEAAAAKADAAERRAAFYAKHAGDCPADRSMATRTRNAAIKARAKADALAAELAK